ncbi:MAG: hypothetical protein NT091_04810 [Candidatus Falkowbacteria bacterium]|nr:hypothetical protein [Candidatus Falkowbacteria bacterium]
MKLSLIEKSLITIFTVALLFTGKIAFAAILCPDEIDGIASTQFIDCTTCLLKDKAMNIGSDSFAGNTFTQSTNPTFTIDTNGRVGIGTTTPNAKLHIYDTRVNAEIDLQSRAGANAHFAIYTATSTIASTSDTLRFWADNGNDILTITRNGRIGIGSTSPVSSFVINATDGLRIPVGTIAQRPVSSIGMIRFNTETVSFEGFDGSAWSSLGGVIDTDQNTKAYVSSNSSDDWIKFNTAGSLAMTIASTTYVGIGTSSPLAKLDVYGDIVLSGATTTNRYLNFGPSAGINGFGLRSNAGVLEFKNAADTSWNEFGSGGTSQKIASTSHGFVVGDILRFASTTNSYVKAQADNKYNAEVIGVVSKVIDANNFMLATGGYVDLSLGAITFVPGETYFLATSTPSVFTATEPNGSSDISKPIFTAVTTKAGYFVNHRGVLNMVSAARVNNSTASYMAYYDSFNNVSGTNQLVANGGTIGIGTTTPNSNYDLDVNGDIILSGATSSVRYLSFGMNSGASGFGFRSNQGALEFKNADDTNWNQFGSSVVTMNNHGFVEGDVLRFSTSTPGAYVKAQANNKDNADVVGVVSKVVNINSFNLIAGGYVNFASSTMSFVYGQNYYLATSTAGALTNIEPTGAGEVSKPVFTATAIDKGYFINYRGNVQLAAKASTNIGTSSRMAFYSASDTIDSTDNIVVSGGAVGIGTSTPDVSYKLDVDGDVHIGGALTVGSVSFGAGLGANKLKLIPRLHRLIQF